MEDYGCNYIHMLPHLVTTFNSSSKNCLIDLKLKISKNSHFLSIFYSKHLREYRRPKTKIGDRGRISKYVFLFRKGYKSQFTQVFYEIVVIATWQPTTYTIKNDQYEIIRVKFYQKEFI